MPNVKVGLAEVTVAGLSVDRDSLFCTGTPNEKSPVDAVSFCVIGFSESDFLSANWNPFTSPVFVTVDLLTVLFISVMSFVASFGTPKVKGLF